MFLIEVFKQGGLLMYPLVLIVLVVSGIVARTLWELFVRGGTNAAVMQNGLDGLLFWGGFAVIIGVLGSVLGYHRAFSALAAKGLLHPKLLWMGTAEGMVSSIAGLLILSAAGLCWFVLRWLYLGERQPAR